LDQSPCIELDCGHIFHYGIYKFNNQECIKTKITKKWTGARITFGFLNCPICTKLISQETLKEVLSPYIELLEDVKSKSMMRLKYENLDKSDDIIKETGKYYKNEIGFALHNFAYYICYDCKVIYDKYKIETVLWGNEKV
jgi:RCR-type E3 ubiquitin transferase